MTSKLPVFVTAYGKKLTSDLDFPEKEGRTKQSFKDECDINIIMARYQQTGVLDFVQRGQPRYLDATGVDFQAAMQLVATAKTQFAELPSSVRLRFKNDPAAFLDFVQNPKNRDEMRELGLLRPENPAQNAPQGAATAPSAPPPVSPTGVTPPAPPAQS